MRIRRQILRWVDKGSQDGYTDQSVISLIGMKGEDKALGYTWDYRKYGARNPQAYNDPKLFEEYSRQDIPEYRNLTWLHSGTKDTKIRQEERKNEEFALNVADGLTSLVNPNPRVKAPILAGIRNLTNIKPTVAGSDPLLQVRGISVYLQTAMLRRGTRFRIRHWLARKSNIKIVKINWKKIKNLVRILRWKFIRRKLNKALNRKNRLSLKQKVV